MMYILFIILLVLVLIIAWKYKLADLLFKKFVEGIKKGEPISTSIVDAFPHFRSIEDYPLRLVSEETMNKLARNGEVSLGPGVYDFYLQSFCLDVGKYVPTSKSHYLIAPLKGKQSTAIQYILKNSAKHPDISQDEIQTLIWAISSGTKYKWMSQDLQLLAERLLPEKELMFLGKSYLDKIPGTIRNRLLTELKSRLPKYVFNAIYAFDKVKEKISDARTTYEELERVVMRFGKPPVPKNIPIIKKGEWSLIDNGYFMRVFPEDYRRTRAQIYIPKRYAFYFEKDSVGRITRIDIKDGITMKITFDESPEKSKLVLNDGKEIPVWRFKKLEFSAPDSKTEKELNFKVENTGWVAKDYRELASLDSKKYPEIREHIENAKDIYHDKQMLKKSLLSVYSLGSKRSTKKGKKGGVLSKWKKFQMNENNKMSEDYPLENLERNLEKLTSEEIQIKAVDSIWKDFFKGSYDKRMKHLIDEWFGTLGELQNDTFSYLNWQLGNTELEDSEQKKFHCPINIIAVPANPNDQRLGLKCNF